MEKTVQIQLQELREQIAQELEAETGYEMELSGGSHTFIPRFIAVGIARGNK